MKPLHLSAILIIMISCNNNLSISNNGNKLMNSCIETSCSANEEEFKKLTEFISNKNLSRISPKDYLEYLKKIDCAEMSFKTDCFPKGWIKQSNLNELLELLDSREKCPKIRTPKQKLISNTISLDSVYIKGSTVGIEALHLINSYYVGYYPCDNIYSKEEIKSQLKK